MFQPMSATRAIRTKVSASICTGRKYSNAEKTPSMDSKEELNVFL
jgi:hypothetical protein